MNKKPTFYITTPIYYPSGNLHIGHAYTTTLAWVLRNYKRLNGYDTLFMTGADEHGQKIQEKADAAKQSPQDYVDAQSEKFKALWTLLEIDYDYYSRTTSEQHKQAVVKQFSQLYQQGQITKGEYVGWYSVSDEEFLTPLQAVNKDGVYYHPVSGAALVRVAEPSYMFHMSKYAEWLKTYFAEHPQFVLPIKVANELMSNFLAKGLEDLSVSRSTFDWGIKLAEDPQHVMYVWLDALNNYLTILGYNNAPHDQDYQKFWVNGTERVHLVGKEIARFHAIYWPIILHAAQLKLPTTVLAHGWLITPEGKMSKSKGNVVDPVALVKTYGAETLKYFFCAQIAVGNDGTFSEELLISTYNTDLANTYGNLVSRTLTLIKTHFNRPLVLDPALVSPTETHLQSQVATHFANYQHAMDQFQVQIGLKSALDLAAQLNRYIEAQKPWTLGHDLAKLEIVLMHLLHGIYAVSVMLSVVIPQKAQMVIAALNGPAADFSLINDWTKFNQISPKHLTNLFPRIKSK